MAKVFVTGHQLTDSDLIFMYIENGVAVSVDQIEAKVYSVTACGKTEMRLSTSEIRVDGTKYWFDSIITHGLPLGNYEIAWVFTSGGLQRVAFDEFSVVRDTEY